MASAERHFEPTARLAKSTSSYDDTRRGFVPRQPLIEIGARHQLAPLAQGELDSLCSLYAVINGLRLACHPTAPMTKAQSKKLFLHGIAYLDRKKGLEEAVTEGLYTRRRSALARHLASLASSPERRFLVERANPDLNSIEEIFGWIADSIFDCRPVLVSLMGRLNHLSVVSGISSKKLLLFDSGGLNHVRKSSCGMRDGHHQIAPNGLMRITVQLPRR